MSFIIETYVREGIVMAADSRVAYSNTTDEGGVLIHSIGVFYNESTNKLFLAPNNVGISFSGDASIDGIPISGIIESFIYENIDEEKTVTETAERLLAYFRILKPDLNTTFHIAGYQNEAGIAEQVLYTVVIKQNFCEQSNKHGEHGAKWSGEIDVLSRIISNMGVKNSNGNYSDLYTYQIEFDHFALQDAVDFSMYAVRTTIDTIRFQTRNKTVGGPIDVLIIKPDSAYWLQKKKLSIIK